MAAYAQRKTYQFMRLDVRQGLSHNQVNTIYKDGTGFWWFGTMSGLNRYDGYDFKEFRNDLNDSSTLSDNYISRIFELPENKMWIVTRNGNNIYDPATESFSRNDQRYLASLSLPGGPVTFITKDKQGDFWFVYQNLGGIYKYSPEQKNILRFSYDPNDSLSIATSDVATLAHDHQNNTWVVHRNGIIEKIDHLTSKVTIRSNQLRKINNGRNENYSLFIDNDDELWISVPLSGTTGGVYWYKPLSDSLEHLSKESGKFRLNTNIVAGVVQDNEGKIWIGTDHGGVNIIDKKNKRIQYLLNDAEDHTSISQNTIWSIYKDNTGVIWLGTFKQGINYYSSQLALFDLYKHKTLDVASLPFEDINKFAEDADGNLWIGTNGGGLLHYDRKLNTFKSFRHNPADPNSISSDVVVSLCIDHENKLWIGTYFGGLNCFDGEKFIHFKHNPADSGSISDDSIWEIFEDSDHNLWMGTLTGGMNLYDRKTKRFKHFDVENRSLHSNYISVIIEDRLGNILFGTSNGIDVLHKASGKFTYLGHDDANSTSLSNNNVMSMLEDGRGLIWVGTREGLNVMHKDGKNFSVFRKSDGLIDNTILTILEDNSQNLWVGTPNGISHVIVSSNDSGKISVHFVNYDESNGLQGREFNDKAAYKTRSGELIFGGPYGFNIFSPDKFESSKTSPRIVLTGLQIFNEEVLPHEKIDGHIVLTESITQTKKINLKYNQNVFSISFSALGLGLSARDKYQYKLAGFNKEWLTTDGRQRTLTYTNIDPGQYTLMIRPEGTTGTENTIALDINVLPPFWKTTPAFLLYMLAIIALLLAARYFTIQRANIRFQMSQQKKEAERVHELDMLKLKFFTNVSHEFRTPISLILAPIEKMMKQAVDGAQKKQYQLIYRNAKRLLGLVNQLLDFRKLEMKELRLYASVGDIVSFIKELTLSFSDLAEKKNIDFTFSTTQESVQTSFDPDKIERVMFNLLSNAFKFTPEHGKVAVDISIRHIDKQGMVDIMVSDSGIGIPEENREKIFERYFQHDTSDNLLGQGSGIGLAISKEFVRLHGGEISSADRPGGGTVFTVSLPVTEDTGEFSQQNYVETEMQMNKALEHIEDEPSGNLTNGRKTVLVVDDNDDIRFYIKDNLRHNYIVYQASNGKEGWSKAEEFQPDLIISDIMMPDMDGLSLCRKIKTDPRTSHIPVILLTARSADEQKLEGFSTGAIDYITKPFSFEILQVRIKNIMAQQEALRKLFQRQIEINPAEIVTSPVDEDFIARAVEVVEKNIAETEFSVEDLSKAMLMSRVALYKKLLSLTGKAPLDFIKTIRMKRAAQLLEKTQMTISEIAYEVGFSNPKYFTKYFKKEFNQLPSEYLALKRKKV